MRVQSFSLSKLQAVKICKRCCSSVVETEGDSGVETMGSLLPGALVDEEEIEVAGATKVINLSDGYHNNVRSRNLCRSIASNCNSPP